MLAQRLRVVAADLLRRAASHLAEAADSCEGRSPQATSGLLRRIEGAPTAIYAPSVSDGPLRQGEVLTGIVQAVLTLDSVGTDDPIVDFITHPIVIVATQDCDLDQDFRARKAGKQGQLPSVLVYEVEVALTLLSKLPSSEARTQMRQNKVERYHALEAVSRGGDAVGEGLDDLGIDFKRYFTIPRDEIYKQLATARRRCVLVSPYLEHFSIRAAAFQCRVALPVDHNLRLGK
jgi:hypothetical protein